MAIVQSAIANDRFTSQSRKSKVAILGVPVDNLSMDEVMQVLEEHITEGGFHQVATANVDFLIKAIHDDELRETLCRCDLVLPDGMPLVWASRLMGTPLKERVAGADLVPLLAALSAARGYRLFLLGADEESSAGAAAWMESQYPGVCIAGRYSPEHKSLDQMDHDDILRRIELARPDILLVAFGNPKQEKWLAMHRYRLNVPLCIGVGGALDFLSGKVARAPHWMQSCGLEWAYRMFQEPSRLASRYFNNAAGILRYLSMQLATTTAQKGRNTAGQFAREAADSAAVFRVAGSFSGDLLPSFDSEVCNAIFAGNHIVLDLSETAYLGPDALGTLVHLASVAQRWKRELWLAGVRTVLLRVIHATQLRSQFRIAPKVSDALRRIEPDPLALRATSDKSNAFCQIGGQMIPIDMFEARDIYHQMRVLLKHDAARSNRDEELSFEARR